MVRSARLIMSLTLCGIAIAGSAVWLSQDARGGLLRPGDRDLVDRGARLYGEHCAACHGRNLEGQPNWRDRDRDGYLPAPPHDRSGHTWHHADRLLLEMTKHGIQALVGPDYKTRMPAYKGVLSDEDIIAVLSFIKSRWPKQVQTRHDRINQAAQGR